MSIVFGGSVGSGTLTFGLREALPTQSNSSASSIRALVLSNLRTTLESIRGEGDPYADVSNSTFGVTASTGGSYAGAVTRRYKLRVVTGGVSGTATIVCTDNTPSDQSALWGSGEGRDHGPQATAVTSGTAFDVGTLGVTCTLTWTGTLVAGDVWHVWMGPYATTVGKVTRFEDDRSENDNLIVQAVPDASPIDGPLSKRTELLDVPLIVRLRRSANPDDELEALLADIVDAVMTDETRGGYALWTRVEANVGLALQDTKAYSECQVQVTILYRTSDTDTRSL